MALVPKLLRPSALLRRKAMYSGFLGQSTFWKVIGVIVYGKRTIKRFLGKNTEVIDVAAMGPGRVMQVVTAKPITRRRRRKLEKAGVRVPTLDEHRVLARMWAESRARRAS